MPTIEKIQIFEGRAELRPLKKENSLFSEVLSPWAKTLPGKPGIILDIGAGQGIETKLLNDSGFSAIALEPSSLFGAHSYNDQFVRGTADHLPFKNGAFSGIMCKDALIFFPPESREKMFSEISRSLAQGGSFLLISQRTDALRIHYVPTGSSYPQKETFVSNDHWQEKLHEVSKGGEVFTIEYATDPEELAQLAEENGLTNTSFQSYIMGSDYSKENRWVQIGGFITVFTKK